MLTDDSTLVSPLRPHAAAGRGCSVHVHVRRPGSLRQPPRVTADWPACPLRGGKQSGAYGSTRTALSFDVIFFSILFSSYVNVQEIKLVMEIIKLIKDKKRDVSFRNIGIITHYKAQKMMIQKELDKEFEGKG